MDLRDLIQADVNAEASTANPRLAESNARAPRLTCSAKACRASATWAIRWNNPKLHAPERRKVWLACDEHEVTLREFLSMRGFYRDSVRASELQATDG